MVNSDIRLFLTAASETELNALAAGMPAGYGVPWTAGYLNNRISSGSTGVLWRSVRAERETIQPLALVVHEADRRRLFGRFAQVRSDLSPLSAWCHLLTPNSFDSFDEPTRTPDLGGLEAAWVGLVVAEAILLASMPASKLRATSCFATQTYAIAKTRSLWPKVSFDEICDRLYAARQLTRNNDAKLLKLRQALQPIWSVLGALSGNSPLETGLRPLVAAIQSLTDARRHGSEHETDGLASDLKDLVPEAKLLRSLPTLRPEERLQLFDQLTGLLPDSQQSNWNLKDTAIAFLAGYIATVAAGGASSLGLVTASGANYPQVAAWAYVLGGIGERITWTSSFDGLGRLVARELMRSFRLDEPPECDFALDEAAVLIDPALSDALVHLRIKQGRNVSVSIYPGVNVTIPMLEPVQVIQKNNPRSLDAERQTVGAEEALLILAEFVKTHLEPRVEEKSSSSKSGTQKSYSGSKSRRGGKGGQDLTLPLPKPKRW